MKSRRKQTRSSSPVSISHLGESIVAEMANRRRIETIEALHLAALADRDHVLNIEKFAFTECRLCPLLGRTFDGASRVDVVLWVRQDLAVACELKLGTTRLSNTRINSEFLRGCAESHENKRWAGNMMAILERKFGVESPPYELCVEIGVASIPLAEDWIVIVQPSVLRNWNSASRPEFSGHVRCHSVNELITAFGGKDEFNGLVQSVLNIDFYDSWIEREPNSKRNDSGSPSPRRGGRL